MYVAKTGTSAYTDYNTGAADPSKRKRAGKERVLRLLITQLKYQDPMEPVKDQDFIAQLAQFSALEQTENLRRVMEQFAQSQGADGRIAQATGLLGREVVVGQLRDWGENHRHSELHQVCRWCPSAAGKRISVFPVGSSGC